MYCGPQSSPQFASYMCGYVQKSTSVRTWCAGVPASASMASAHSRASARRAGRFFLFSYFFFKLFCFCLCIYYRIVLFLILFSIDVSSCPSFSFRAVAKRCFAQAREREGVV